MITKELIDELALNLQEQGGPSVQAEAERVSCKYRGPNGAKCAVGHLIADEHYSEDLEGLPAFRNEVVEAVRNSRPDLDLDARDLTWLQCYLHDIPAEENPGCGELVWSSLVAQGADLLKKELEL